MFERLILNHAVSAPEASAFNWLTGEKSFGQFSRDVGKVTAALLRLQELKPRLVGVRHPDYYIHWVFLLALARLGMPSASLPPHSTATLQQALDILDPDLILSDRALDLGSRRVLPLDERWLSHVLNSVEVDVELPFLDPEQTCRVALALGTNNRPRKVALSYRYIEASIFHFLYQDVAAQYFTQLKPRLLPTIGIEAATGFLVVLAALAAGSTVQLSSRESASFAQLGAVIGQKKPTVAVISPGQLAHLLTTLPPGMKPLDNFHLTVAGGKLPRALHEQVLAKLTPNVRIVYGADECSAVTLCDAADITSDDMVGKVLPWSRVEIVDDHDQGVPAGQDGIVRVKGTGVLAGYLDDAEATRTQFRDGWFYPGDRGSLSSNGMLSLAGRIDALTSFGGDKFDLDILDKLLLSCPGVKEGVIFAVPDANGNLTPWAAIITGPEFTAQALSDCLRARYPELPPVTAVWVDRIPLTPAGLPDRMRLRSAALSQREAASTS